MPYALPTILTSLTISTALHLAAMGGLNANLTISLLLKVGADYHALDNLERTALQVAHAYERDFLEELLRSIDPNADEYSPAQVESFKIRLREKYHIDLPSNLGQSTTTTQQLAHECLVSRNPALRRSAALLINAF